MIPRTDGLFIKRMDIVSKMLKELKEEAAAARKRDLQVELEKEVTQSTKVRFRKTECSYIQSKNTQENETRNLSE